MRLNLERDAQGEGNWEPLLERLSEHNESAAETVLAPASAGPNADAGSLAVVLSIARVEVKMPIFASAMPKLKHCGASNN
ncbi:hypothetical protein HSBAA_54820 [Vreelandella sulfidaeris]|uniref:Uncharacterized protein n=1 Tax=Vreelandella sulfidaeris TaxID=115553 RepID=A0A455UD70_9GAMM|nr:hypothetical protein HSBAA_54820 [Halomonas sulfidaeris]